jgi:carbon starvation protein
MSALKQAVAKGGPIGAYGDGFGFLTRYFLGPYGAFVAVIALNAFILTTLDTAARITRYLLQEIFKGMNRYVATVIVVAVSGYVALSGSWQKIWPIFGSANQLIAALTLLVLSSWCLIQKKHLRFTLAPAIFMLVTTVSALIAQLGSFLRNGDYFLLSVDIVLLALAAAMVMDIFISYKKRIKKAQEDIR